MEIQGISTNLIDRSHKLSSSQNNIFFVTLIAGIVYFFTNQLGGSFVIFGTIIFFIFFSLLKSYWTNQFLLFGYFSDYLKLIERKKKEQKIIFDAYSGFEGMSLHGNVSSAADRAYLSRSLQDALNLISRDKDWEYIFKAPNWKINIIYGFKAKKEK